MVRLHNLLGMDVWRIFSRCAFWLYSTLRPAISDFLPERTRAWVSDVIPWDSKGPTIVECLFFWLASATVPQHRPHEWTVPQVSAEIQGGVMHPSTLHSLSLDKDAMLQSNFLSALAFVLR